MTTRYDELIDFVDMLIDGSLYYCEFEVTDETDKCLDDIKKILVALKNHEQWMNKWRDENGKDNSI